MTQWLCHHTKVFIILLSVLTKSNADLDNLNVPCKYLDSINITNGIWNSDDDSIMFEGISYPEKLHATYDYAILNGTHRQRVEPHERGCACAVNPLKPCVRICCPRGQYLMITGGRSACVENEEVFNMPVTVSDGDSSLEGNIFDFFNYVLGKPCSAMFIMEPAKEKQTDTWVLFRNGSISTGDPPTEILGKDQYCLTATPTNESFETTLIVCFVQADLRGGDYFIHWAMFLSVPFLVATVIVYTILPELRNVHGKSLVSYLCGLIVGYISLGLLKLNGSAYIEPTLCRSVGYITYFAFLSAFFWLNVISFDLWRNFCGVYNRATVNDTKKFAYFSIYAWGSTIIMVAITLSMDHISSVPTDFRPAIGVQRCFLGTSRWSQFLYFHLPIMLIMCSNLTFFVLTYWKIREVQRGLEKMTKKDDSRTHRKNFDKEKANHRLFMRLFIVMGVTWSMEPISWIIAPGHSYFYPTDVMNSIQGVVIFLLFVMRVKVKQLMVKRWRIWRGKEQPCTSGTTTDNSDHIDVEMTSNK